MRQITNISLDISIPQLIVVHEKQGDSGRWVYATLLDHGTEYSIPANTYGVVRVRKPDGTGCVYDSDEHGSAVIISGSTVQVCLVDQALTAPGRALCSVGLYNSQAERITAFNFSLDIERDPVADAVVVSSDYYNILTAQIAWVETMYESIRGLTASAVSIGAGQEATATVTGGDGVPFNIAFGIPRGAAGLQTSFIKYSDKAVSQSDFVSDSTYPEYPFKARVPLSAAVTASMTAFVVLGVADQESGVFCPGATLYAGGVEIYATRPQALTIPTILIVDAEVGA